MAKQLPDTPRRLLMTLDRIGKCSFVPRGSNRNKQGRKRLNNDFVMLTCRTEFDEEEHKAHDDGLKPAAAVVHSALIDVEAGKQSSCRRADATRSSVSKRSSTCTLVRFLTDAASSSRLVESLSASSSLCGMPVLQASVESGSPVCPDGRPRVPAAQPL